MTAPFIGKPSKLVALLVRKRVVLSRQKENAMDETINRIASVELSIETLDVRNRDSLDFHDLHVLSIRAALEAAYKAGAESAK